MPCKNSEYLLVACALLTGSLAVTEIALTTAASQLLNGQKTQVAAALPHGILHADPIFYAGVAIIVASSIAILPSILGSVFRLANRCPTGNFRFFGMAAFAYLPVVIVETVIGLTWHASVTSALPQLLVNELVAGSGTNLYYHGSMVEIAVVVNGWAVFTSLVLATILERKMFKATQQEQQKISSPVYLTNEVKDSYEEGI
ncbi:uncharacterized protein MELLADRAFT_73698 [Melampsora larici-populina 98AG31]|uniref:Secreted protein n=1 Tax=Melampsora larici-populina (strain 98AG31 / pathotype 3-4-7) TaxID=747676 RepID=F4SC57_MELLP|nr:uncharacterized protein MELLADRAFT_73698 [Melampsora larici-populina 98AG31]EGF97771.1 hypothetical protein MELLADRAFT_73698 [Melampsora larici-populina 98AG31]